MPYDVTIKRPTPCGMLMLKGDRIAQDRFSEVLGMDIPRISNTATVHDTYSVLWLGPAEWLLIVPESDEDRIASELSYDAADDWAVAIIVSDHYSIITIQGSETTEVLVQACGIDIHPQEFSIGQCCRCAFARTTAIVRPLDSQGTYELILESSYVQYAEHWLSRAIGA